jgi:CrcB protein
MRAWLLVAFGGAVGSMARYGLGLMVAALVGQAFPWGTLLINVLGSLVIGASAGLVGAGGRMEGDLTIGLLVMTGLCGGFTTFSSFSLQTLTLMRSGEPIAALAYVLASVVLCVLATFVGLVMFSPR